MNNKIKDQKKSPGQQHTGTCAVSEVTLKLSISVKTTDTESSFLRNSCLIFDIFKSQITK